VRVAVRLLVVLLLAGGCLVTTANAADRMWMGFTDDPVLRYDPTRQVDFDLVKQNDATIVRTIVVWSSVAATKPANPIDPFDPAYRFDDLDEYVRNAQNRGLEVLMTIWGTPSWANGGKAPQYAPINADDLRAFAQALASRYSGRYPGYPFVRFYGIWNESNLATFLRPQYDSAGKPASPAIYARLAAAGYTGLKNGNPLAQVAIGETSSNGRQRHIPGLTDSLAPGLFAQLVAKANPKLRFDAWAQHPYPFPVNQAPTQVARWPNVPLLGLPKLESALDAGFKRKGIPIWITEYGNETQPGEPRGVTEAQQAVYLPQAIAIVRKDPRVRMFVWFIFRDSPGSTWQSGLYRTDSTPKPAQAAWPVAAASVDMRNGKVTAKGGTVDPIVTVYLRDFCANNPDGAPVGTTTRVFVSGTLVQVTQAQLALGIDCTVHVQLPISVVRGRTYVATIDVNVGGGNTAKRTITVVGN